MPERQQFVYCNECFYSSEECPGDVKCRDTYTQEFDHGCRCGKQVNDDA